MWEYLPLYKQYVHIIIIHDDATIHNMMLYIPIKCDTQITYTVRKQDNMSSI